MTNFSKSNESDWCHFCKCFVNPHPNSKRMHEQSNNHKKNVESKMREIRNSSQKEAREEEMTKKMLAGIEARAAEAYKADLAAGTRPEDTHEPKLVSADVRLRQEQQAAKRDLEEAVERELKVRAEAEYRSQQEKGEWKFDTRSSYYWHAKSSCYFDPKSAMYFDTKASAWSKQAPQVSSLRCSWR
jgi:WW domain-binding protein 4